MISVEAIPREGRGTICAANMEMPGLGGGVEWAKSLKRLPIVPRSYKTYGAFAPSWEVSFLFPSNFTLFLCNWGRRQEY